MNGFLRTYALRVLVATLFAALLAGCLGSIRRNSALRTARDRYAARPSCPREQIVTEIVSEPPPGQADYLAWVAVRGCGAEARYLCSQNDSAWRCNP